MEDEPVTLEEEKKKIYQKNRYIQETYLSKRNPWLFFDHDFTQRACCFGLLLFTSRSVYLLPL